MSLLIGWALTLIPALQDHIISPKKQSRLLRFTSLAPDQSYDWSSASEEVLLTHISEWLAWIQYGFGLWKLSFMPLIDTIVFNPVVTKTNKTSPRRNCILLTKSIFNVIQNYKYDIKKTPRCGCDKRIYKRYDKQRVMVSSEYLPCIIHSCIIMVCYDRPYSIYCSSALLST